MAALFRAWRRAAPGPGPASPRAALLRHAKTKQKYDLRILERDQTNRARHSFFFTFMI